MIASKVEELLPVLEQSRKEGKRIVTCNGAFDIIHPGHIYFLEQAKQQGDLLVVGLNTDSSIKRYKSEDRPVNAELDRAVVLQALESVDHVVLFDEETPLRFLEQVKPDVHCNGEEYGKDCVEAPLLKEMGTKLHLIRRRGEHATTRTVERMRKKKRATE